MRIKKESKMKLSASRCTSQVSIQEGILTLQKLLRRISDECFEIVDKVSLVVVSVQMNQVGLQLSISGLNGIKNAVKLNDLAVFFGADPDDLFEYTTKMTFSCACYFRKFTDPDIA